jgi:hypothetical protein
MLLDMQTWCSVDCCKDRAFQLSPTTIRQWLDGERVDRTCELNTEIAQIEKDLDRCNGGVVLTARGMESNWEGPAFRAFWRLFAEAFAGAISPEIGHGQTQDHKDTP